MNGRRTAIPSPEDVAELVSRIDHIQDEIAALQSAGLPLEQRIDTQMAELEDCRAAFLKHGFAFNSPMNTAQAWQWRYRLLVGAIMVAGGENFLRGATEKREAARFEAGGFFGVAPDVREAGVARLRRDLKVARAKLELAFRRQEQAGLSVERGSAVEPELYLAGDADLAQIADGAEVAA